MNSMPPTGARSQSQAVTDLRLSGIPVRKGTVADVRPENRANYEWRGWWEETQAAAKLRSQVP